MNEPATEQIPMSTLADAAETRTLRDKCRRLEQEVEARSEDQQRLDLELATAREKLLEAQALADGHLKQWVEERRKREAAETERDGWQRSHASLFNLYESTRQRFEEEKTERLKLGNDWEANDNVRQALREAGIEGNDPAAGVRELVGQRGEAFAMLRRCIKYAREDRMTTPGCTRLARALAEAERQLGATPPAPPEEPVPDCLICHGKGYTVYEIGGGETDTDDCEACDSTGKQTPEEPAPEPRCDCSHRLSVHASPDDAGSRGCARCSCESYTPREPAPEPAPEPFVYPEAAPPDEPGRSKWKESYDRGVRQIRDALARKAQAGQPGPAPEPAPEPLPARWTQNPLSRHFNGPGRAFAGLNADFTIDADSAPASIVRALLRVLDEPVRAPEPERAEPAEPVGRDVPPLPDGWVWVETCTPGETRAMATPSGYPTVFACQGKLTVIAPPWRTFELPVEVVHAVLGRDIDRAAIEEHERKVRAAIAGALDYEAGQLTSHSSTTLLRSIASSVRGGTFGGSP